MIDAASLYLARPWEELYLDYGRGLTLSKTSRELGHVVERSGFAKGKWQVVRGEDEGSEEHEDGYNKRLWLSERRRLMIVALEWKRIALDIFKQQISTVYDASPS